MRVVRLSGPGRVVVALLSAALVALGVSVPASAAQLAHPHTWQVAVGQEADHDAIQGMAFLPGTLWIDKGDTIVWTARAGEIHTVTFLATGQPLTPFNPNDPTQLFPQGGTSYDGVSYFNSGVLTDEVDSGFPAGTTYRLSFDTTGDFTYYCLVHGVMMKGVVHVRAAGTRYPFTQAQYNRMSAHQRAAIIRDGFKLWRDTAKAATNHMVFAGADDGTAMVMRWIGQTVHVRVGSSVTFVNNGMAAPHTVTFGPEQPNIFVPYGDPTNFTGQPLNSGLFLPGATFTVTFTKKGSYHYICGLHDYLHMVGTVVVR
jgi:plastocyanin